MKNWATRNFRQLSNHTVAESDMVEREKCNRPAMYRYTWAGQDESFCCFIHGQQIQGVAQVMGYHLQLIPLDEEKECQNEVPVGE